MTASAASRRARVRRALAALGAVAALGLGACETPSPTPAGTALAPLPGEAPYVPDEIDLSLRDLARALLAGDTAAADEAVDRVGLLDAERVAPSGALPYAVDARAALLGDPIQRRRRAAELLEREDLPPELRARLEQEVADDPLRLADERLRDARTRRIALWFNGLSQAAGRSITNTALLPFRLANALVAIALAEHMEEEMSAPERQALRHWKAYIEQHPDTPEAAVLVEEVAEAQIRWYETYRDRTVGAARDALEAGEPAQAALHLDRALRYAPEDGESHELLQRAQAEMASHRAERTRSVAAPRRVARVGPGERALAIALLDSSPGSEEPTPLGEVAARADALRALEPGGPLADDAGLAQALVLGELGERAAMWERLQALADAGDGTTAARHARTALSSPTENPLALWHQARRAETLDQVRWLVLGPLAAGPRDRNLPRMIEWMLEIPTLIPVVTGFGNRLVRIPWYEGGRRSPGVFAHRYLERWPEGDQGAEVRAWLIDHERDRGNFVGALRLAEEDPLAEPDELARMRQAAAEQALEQSLAEPDLVGRLALLRRVATRFEGTEAGREAAWELRQSLREATPQHIRVSRGFLEEHAEVAGPGALALRSELLDGEKENGELHPEGIALLGGRHLEVAYLSTSGDPRDEPVRRRERISEERLGRVVASLEEATLRAARTDHDYPVEYDADRDLFFERARLGVAAEAHPSPEARSSYAFRGVRERYGLVRSRESILPVELVLQGSFEDMSLGAFPRIRMPKPTPDAFLYR